LAVQGPDAHLYVSALWGRGDAVLLEDAFLWRVEGGLRTPFLWKRVRSPRCTVWEGDHGVIKE